MDLLDVGIDIGFSKNNLAVAGADGQSLLETRVENFDQKHQELVTEELSFSVIIQQLAPFKAHPLSIFIGGFVDAPRSFFDRLCDSGFDVRTLEVFTDVHNHY